MINITNQNNYSKTPGNYKDDNDLKNCFEESDVVYITKLCHLKDSLCGDHLNIKSINEQIKDLDTVNNINNYNYLNSLLYPEKTRGATIPSQIPVPSCSFQLRQSITISPNNQGSCAFVFNPFFLASEELEGYPLPGENAGYFSDGRVTTFWLNQNIDAPQPNALAWMPTMIGQTLPPVYEQYRLVSAALHVRYIGRLDQVSGIVGCAVIYQDSPDIGAFVQPRAGSEAQYNPNGTFTPSANSGLAKYSNLEYIRDSYYYQENSCLEGIRALYFPIDNSYEEYVRTCDGKEMGYSGQADANRPIFKISESYFKSGFNWFFYAMNAPPSTNCFKVDIFCNFECLPNSRFLNYMPVSVNPCYITPEEKKKIIMLLQSKSIFKLNEGGECDFRPGIINKMIKKFKNGLPGFDKLKLWGVISALPSLKPGIALAGNMIQQQMQMDNY